MGSPMRVLLDANILVSYLIVPQHSPISRIMEAAYKQHFTLLIPYAVLDELVATVRTKPRLLKRINLYELDKLVEDLATTAELLHPTSEEILPISRDRKDDYLLTYALIGRADYLITGDDDLLVLDGVGNFRIMRPSDFELVLEEMGE